jgi:hypothetical protein
MRCWGSFGEQVEPVYRAADRLVRDRIKKEVARRIEQMDSGGRTTKSEEPPPKIKAAAVVVVALEEGAK